MNPFAPQPDRDRQPTEPDQIESEGDALAADSIDEVLHDPLLRFRATRFASFGFNARQSRVLSLNRQIDTHFVEGLVANGCPLHLAFDIAS